MIRVLLADDQALVRAGQPVDKNALRDPETPLQSLAGQ